MKGVKSSLFGGCGKIIIIFEICQAKINFLTRNYQEFDVCKMWILWKMRLGNCEFCENCDFENVNFVNNETLKMWILLKMRLWKCEFCEKMTLWNC